jgi:23S rRNA pseudouridine1911/1915/1917 synthase
MKSLHFKVQNDISVRIDKYISEYYKLFSRSQLKYRIVKILLNNKEVSFSKKVKSGDEVQLYYNLPPEPDLVPEKIPLDILYEDNNIIVVNKPQGMVVHPASGQWSGTLLNALLYYVKDLKKNFKGENIRPGIIHRLDKDTSGVIILAKNVEALEYVSGQFRERRIKKHYIALVKGIFQISKGWIKTCICRDPHHRKRFKVSLKGGKLAATYYKTIRTFHYKSKNYTLVSFWPRTGRTHQIRVHAKYSGCPILGDSVYSKKDDNFTQTGLMLHALSIRVKLPETQGGISRTMTIKAPLPSRFKDILKELSKIGI